MNVILSIKPEFVERIFSGEKKYEYRKVKFKQDIDIVYIYASRPVGRIVGQFRISEIIYDTPSNVWQKTKRYGGISKEHFESYFKGKSKSIAIGIKEAIKYNNSLSWAEAMKGKQVPQSFIYIDKDLKEI